MAQIRLRPGPWKLVDDGTGSADREIQIDYEKFTVVNNGTVEFEVQKMGLFDDEFLTAYRNPVATVVSVGNTGGSTNIYNPLDPPPPPPRYVKGR